MSQIHNIVKDRLEEVWGKEILKKNILATVQVNPQAFVLGGQPGAGKSSLSEQISKILHENLIIINGDDFRKYHPDYAKFQEIYKQDSTKYTAEFSGLMTETILQKAINEKYNIIIEGTFRTSKTPIKTLQKLKDNSYTTNVMIQTCNKEISWNSCLERYEKMLQISPKEARYTLKENHDNVVNNLSKNIKEVQKSGLADTIQIYARIPLKNNNLIFEQKEIYNSSIKAKVNTATIDKYLGLNKNINNELGYSF